MIQQASDTALGLPVAQPAPIPHPAFAAALPSVWVMAGITIGLFVLMAYLLKVPSQYPLRGTIVAFTTFAFVGSLVILGIQVWHTVPHQLSGVKADIQAAAQEHQETEVAKQPVAELTTYVPPMPGTDSAVRHEALATNGMPSGTVWDETTNQSVAQVVKYYAEDANHPGWQVEFSAPNGMVLRRTITAGGSLENERIRILARPNVDPHGKKTEIEFELTRRMK